MASGSLERGDDVAMLLCDLTKSFDFVTRSLLLEELENVGINDSKSVYLSSDQIFIFFNMVCFGALPLAPCFS